MTALRCSEVVLAALLLCATAHAQDPMDSDGDGVIDVLEVKGDSDDDGIPDYLDPDDDGDSVLTRFEYTPGELIDFDRDGALDYLDVDDDNDRLLTKDEECDPNGDGNPKDARTTTGGLRDYLNPDDDADNVPTQHERPDDKDRDTDGDHTPDHRDRDDDGDSRFTVEEFGASNVDHDGDGLPDFLDADDDDDTIPTVVEFMVFAWRDVDEDGLINPLDLDSDGDGIPDQVEGTGDADGDGMPDYLDPIDNRKPEDGMGNVLQPAADAGRDGGARDASVQGLDAGGFEDAGISYEQPPGLTTVSRSHDSGGCNVGGGQPLALLLWLLRRRRKA